MSASCPPQGPVSLDSEGTVSGTWCLGKESREEGSHEAERAVGLTDSRAGNGPRCVNVCAASVHVDKRHCQCESLEMLDRGSLRRGLLQVCVTEVVMVRGEQLWAGDHSDDIQIEHLRRGSRR